MTSCRRGRGTLTRMGDQGTTVLVVVLVFAVDLAIRVAALVIIPRDRKPSAAMAWLLAVFLIPYVGVFFYLLIGSSHLPRSRREKQQRVNTLIASAMNGVDLPTDRSDWPGWLAPVAEMNRAVGAIPIVGGNEAHLIDDYEGSFAAIAADIDAALDFVHVEFYIVSFDSTTVDLFAALEAAVARGVSVRVLLDHVASVRAANHKQTFAELDRIGVHWSFMLPVQPLKGRYQRPDLRNHRKIVVVDGRVAYMGSQNLIDRSYNSKKNIARGLRWQELMTRITGPVVAGVNAVFLGDWYCETGELLERERVPASEVARHATSDALSCQVVPSGPGFDGENNLRLFLALLHSARERIIITSPYFVPDEAMMYAITSAVQRGLDVQLFVSEIGDQGPVYHAQRSYYRELLTAGVHIWMYPAPFILHAKHLSIDDDVAVIGSSNMDIRSFALDLEVSLLVHGASFVSEMRRVEAGYRAAGRELTLEEWNREPRSATFLDGVARLTSALQ
jgi:cardiolipin synthase